MLTACSIVRRIGPLGSHPTLTTTYQLIAHCLPFAARFAHPSSLTTCHSLVTCPAVGACRLPCLILSPLTTHYLPVPFRHLSHTAPHLYCPAPHAPLITHRTPFTTHHTPLITHHAPLIAYHSLISICHSLLTTHHSPLTTHPSRLASHDSRLPTHYSPSSLMLVILHDSPRPLTLTAHPSPLPLTSPSCHSTPSICCSLLTTHHSTFLRIANHLNMSDVCRSAGAVDRGCAARSTQCHALAA